LVVQPINLFKISDHSHRFIDLLSDCAYSQPVLKRVKPDYIQAEQFTHWIRL